MLTQRGIPGSLLFAATRLPKSPGCRDTLPQLPKGTTRANCTASHHPDTLSSLVPANNIQTQQLSLAPPSFATRWEHQAVATLPRPTKVPRAPAWHSKPQHHLTKTLTCLPFAGHSCISTPLRAHQAMAEHRSPRKR